MNTPLISYGAFLRGVNVNGTRMKMNAVCAVVRDCGMHQVQSVLASGNILFSSNKENATVKQLLETALSDYFTYEAYVFVKTKTEIEALLYHNPFAADEAFHHYVFIGIEGIEKILMDEFERCEKTVGEEAQLVAGHFYWKTLKGSTTDAPFGKILGRKSLKNAFTSRNIHTFEKVLKKF